MQQQKPLEGAQPGRTEAVRCHWRHSCRCWTPPLLTWRSPLSPGIWAHRSAEERKGVSLLSGGENAISIPLTGWLAKRVGEVKLFLWSTIAFAISSWAWVSPAA